ncbi:MAG TPA: cohesin domain-containing protein [Candidatus Thermoplasmatota archaeon]|nr:cohesin domain-containing protein [Candidatus Thermoplasmatota archaeon]
MAGLRPLLRRLLATDRRVLAVALAGTVALAALAAPALAQGPNPTPGATPAVARAFAGDPALRLASGNLTTGHAYDLTVTNVSGSGSNLSAGSSVTLRRPNGTPAATATAYADGQDGPGALNATFANVTFNVAGNWTVTGGFLNKTLRVQAAPANGTARAALSAPNATAPYGQTARVPVTLLDVSDLGSITFVLAWDPSVATVVSVEAGDVPGANASWNLQASNGTLRVVLATGTIPGPSGSFALAHVTLRATAATGGTTPLAVGAEEAVRSDGTPFPVDPRHGSFRGGLLGDADGDGDVDADDARAILDMAAGVGSPAYLPSNADVNADGRVTGADAMRVMQRVSGARGSFPAGG